MGDVFRRICTFAFLFGALTTAVSGQHLTVGVKGGVPLLDAFEPNPSSVVAPFVFTTRYTSITKRYTVGPAVDVSLPLKLRFEANALYTRLAFDSAEIVPISPPTRDNPSLNPVTFASTTER